jgi:hypothetical protein
MSDDVLIAILTERQHGQSRLETGHQELESDVTGLRSDLIARMALLVLTNDVRYPAIAVTPLNPL